MTNSRLTRKVLEVARSEFKDVEFTAKEMLERLKKVWRFKLSVMRVWHILKSRAEHGDLTGRKKHLDEWAWSGTAYVWVWKLV